MNEKGGSEKHNGLKRKRMSDLAEAIAEHYFSISSANRGGARVTRRWIVEARGGGDGEIVPVHVVEKVVAVSVCNGGS